MSLAELRALGRPSEVLAGGPRDLPTRHRRLRNALAWSYDLLNRTAQALFRHLAVSVGGCTIAAVEAVSDPEGEAGAGVSHVLGVVLDHSLVCRPESVDGTSRLTMLETLREYACELLEQSGETERLQGQHAAHYLALAERAEPAQEALGGELSAAVWAEGRSLTPTQAVAEAVAREAR